MNSSKPGVRLIADACKAKGIRYAVFSPGSRSAPLVIAFSQIPEIEYIVIPDERSAGYFALGLAQQTGIPVAVICTSGTAVLNLGPALCEAFYQHIPLLFLTADRPEGAADKGENQAINQAFLFKEMTNGSYDVNADVTGVEEIKSMGGQIELAIHQTAQPVPGPVHVNVRLSEPLYELTTEAAPAYQLSATPTEIKSYSSSTAISELKKQLSKTTKRLIIVGMKDTDREFAEKLQLLAKNDIVVLIETAANAVNINPTIDPTNTIINYDACLDLILEKEAKDFAPELVITFGNQIISKKIRQFLKANKSRYHWDISPYNEHRKHNIFDIDTNAEPISQHDALECLFSADLSSPAYASKWQKLYTSANKLTAEYVAKAPFTDLKVFDLLIKAFPESAHIQYGNSTPIRYANFFAHHGRHKVNANRGTSGIDGPVSTAAGAAYASKQLTICVVGDISFFYDSNALWNNYLSPNLRIVLINNSGGNIFRLLKGPTTVSDFEKFFETKHNLTAKHLAAMYEIPYYFCDQQEGLEKLLPDFFQPQNGKPAILEIKTDGELSAKVYKEYFEFLKNNANSQ